MVAISPNISDAESGDDVFVCGYHLSEEKYRGTYTGVEKSVSTEDLQSSLVKSIGEEEESHRIYYQIRLDDEDDMSKVISNPYIELIQCSMRGRTFVRDKNLYVVKRDFDEDNSPSEF